MVEQISGLILTVFYNSIFFIFCLTIFLFYRSFRAKPGAVFSELELSSWKSIKKAYSLDDNERAGFVHLEGYLYLNFIKNCCYFLLSCSLVGSLTLIPIYANLEVSATTELSNLSIKHKGLYEEDLIVPGICSVLLALGTFLLCYSYFLQSNVHPHIFPSVFFI